MFDALPRLGRVLFVSGALLTHAAVGYALVRAVTDANPRLGLLCGVLPDADFLFPPSLGFPFIHRGIVHTPVFALGLVGLVYALANRDTTLATAVALASHLAIDGLSPAGIMWLYPLTAAPSPGLPVHGPSGTITLWLVVGGVLVYESDGGIRERAVRTVQKLRD